MKNPPKILVVCSEFNTDLSEALLESCLKGFAELKIEPVVVRVPGALEIPIMLKWHLEQGGWDACIALGVIIRGETGHYDSLSRMIETGIMKLNLKHQVPITFEVLMADTRALIEARIEKGYHAAFHAVRMADLRREVLGMPKSQD